MYDYDDQFAKVGATTVLCIGDLMLDDFVYGDVTRISPEAPTPVIAVKREQKVIGGAGNVARGIAALGAHCVFVSVMGEDEAGRLVARAFLDECPSVETHLIVDPSRPTTRKVRFVSEHHSTHLLRADWEFAAPVNQAVEHKLISAALGVLPRADAVVLSDYAKGVLSPNVIRVVIDAANKLGKPVVVDPKGLDYGIYRGATLITPNRKELGEATRRKLANVGDIVAAAEELACLVESDAVLVTRSEEGMTLYTRTAEPLHVPAYPVKIRDVSGAGDTVAAVLAVMLAAKVELEPAVRSANAAAAVVVGKRGTATVSLAELRTRILPAAFLAPEEKIVFDSAVLDERLAEWRRLGLRIGFTNGCFDLLHPGHIKLLTEARCCLRSPHRRPQHRRLGQTPQGQRPPGAGPAGPRRSALRAGSGRSRGAVRRGYAARTDPARDADGARQRRGLSGGSGRRPRTGRSTRRRSPARRTRARAQHDPPDRQECIEAAP